MISVRKRCSVQGQHFREGRILHKQWIKSIGGTSFKVVNKHSHFLLLLPEECGSLYITKKACYKNPKPAIRPQDIIVLMESTRQQALSWPGDRQQALSWDDPSTNYDSSLGLNSAALQPECNNGNTETSLATQALPATHKRKGGTADFLHTMATNRQGDRKVRKSWERRKKSLAFAREAAKAELLDWSFLKAEDLN